MREAGAAGGGVVSGGSYQYVYSQIDGAADELERRTSRPGPTDVVHHDGRWLTPAESAPILAKVQADRLWLAGLLRLVAKAMHDVEWVDSSDYGPSDELPAIRAVRDYASTTIELEEPDEDAPVPVDSVGVAS